MDFAADNCDDDMDDTFQATQPTQEIQDAMLHDTESFVPSKCSMPIDGTPSSLESLFSSESSEHSLAGGNKQTVYRGSNSAVFSERRTSHDMATSLDSDRSAQSVAHAKSSRDAGMFATYRAAGPAVPLQIMTHSFDSGPFVKGKSLSEIDISRKGSARPMESFQHIAKPTPLAVAKLSPSEIPLPKHVSKLHFMADRERVDVCTGPSDIYDCLFNIFTKNNVYASFSPDEWAFFCVAYPGGIKVEFCVQAFQRRREEFENEEWIKECTVIEFYKRGGCPHTYSMLMQTIRFAVEQTLTLRDNGVSKEMRKHGASGGAREMPPLTLPEDIPPLVPNPEELKQSLNVLVAVDVPASAKLSIISFVQELVCEGASFEVLDNIGIDSILKRVLDISKDSEVLRLTLGLAETLCRRESFARRTLQSSLFQKIIEIANVSVTPKISVFELQRIALCVVQSIAKHEGLRGALRTNNSGILVESLRSSPSYIIRREVNKTMALAY